MRKQVLAEWTFAAPVHFTPRDHGAGAAPEIVPRPLTFAPAGKSLTVTAEGRDSSGVKWVRLRCRSLNQHEDYHALAMLPTVEMNQSSAVIPAEYLVPTRDVMYFIEAMDTEGHVRIHPNLKNETPYIVVNLQH
jgi:hypothetical protein